MGALLGMQTQHQQLPAYLVPYFSDFVWCGQEVLSMGSTGKSQYQLKRATSFSSTFSLVSKSTKR